MYVLHQAASGVFDMLGSNAFPIVGQSLDVRTLVPNEERLRVFAQSHFTNSRFRWSIKLVHKLFNEP